MKQRHEVTYRLQSIHTYMRLSEGEEKKEKNNINENDLLPRTEKPRSFYTSFGQFCFYFLLQQLSL